MINVLHITTHMGGGVGRVLSSIASYAICGKLPYHHRILILDNPIKKQFIDLCKKNGVDLIISDDPSIIQEEMIKADIVQLNWWNHPKMAEFLYKFPQIPIRLIIWFHVNGCNYPIIQYEFIKNSHKVFFTTEYSFENAYWDNKQREYIFGKAEVIYGVGDLEQIKKKDYLDHESFNIGYIGTLNYSKLNSEFIKLYSMVDVPKTKFIMVGDTENKNVIENEAIKYGISDKLEFTGYVEDVNNILASFDVFAYPLNPLHYGSTENALLEAMAAGVPVVALDQCAEKYLVRHMETGLLAKDANHFVQLIRYLYENPNERKRLGENARNYVLEHFSLKNNILKMNKAYDAVMSMGKNTFKFDSAFGTTPYQWFLACLGKERELFEASINESFQKNKVELSRIERSISCCSYILREETKSSVSHFSDYFPNDKILKYWKRLIK